MCARAQDAKAQLKAAARQLATYEVSYPILARKYNMLKSEVRAPPSRVCAAVGTRRAPRLCACAAVCA